MMSKHQLYMLDTNFFNAVLDGEIPPEALTGRCLLVTGIQADELRNTKNSERRSSLLFIFKEISPSIEPASSFTLGVEGAGLGQAHLNNGNGLYDQMLLRLQELDQGKKERLNQVRDILIAETAIKSRAVLVSGDRNLRQVISEFGGYAIDNPIFCTLSKTN